MNFSRLNTVINIVIALIFAIAIYHLYMIVDSENQLIRRIYHLSFNGVVITLMFYIRSTIKPNFKIYKKILLISSLYFIYKVILNIAFMFDCFRIWQSQFNRDIWSLMLAIIILTLLIILKFQNND